MCTETSERDSFSRYQKERERGNATATQPYNGCTTAVRTRGIHPTTLLSKACRFVPLVNPSHIAARAHCMVGGLEMRHSRC